MLCFFFFFFYPAAIWKTGTDTKKIILRASFINFPRPNRLENCFIVKRTPKSAVWKTVMLHALALFLGGYIEA